MRSAPVLLYLLFSIHAVAQKINTAFTYTVRTPVHATARPPVIILLHGYGSDESDLFSFAPLLNPNCIVFSLRAPNEVQGSGYCWFPLGFLPRQQFSYNYAEIVASRKNILSFI